MDYTSRHFSAYTKSTYYAVRPHLIFNLASYLAWKVLCLRLCVWCRHGTPSLTLLASDPLLITHTCLPSVSSICMISTSYCTHLRPWCPYPYWSCDLIVPCLFFYLHANCVSFPVLQNHYLPSGRPTAWTLSNHLATNPSQPTPLIYPAQRRSRHTSPSILPSASAIFSSLHSISIPCLSSQ